MGQKDVNAFSTDEIRQIQVLALLLSNLPSNGKLGELLELALSLPQQAQLARVTPVSDTSYDGLKAWLETLWIRQDLTPDEQRLVNWQNEPENMQAAIQELKTAEQKLGLRLGILTHSEILEREHELSQINL